MVRIKAQLYFNADVKVVDAVYVQTLMEKLQIALGDGIKLRIALDQEGLPYFDGVDDEIQAEPSEELVAESEGSNEVADSES